jgi:hypothetical protein
MIIGSQVVAITVDGTSFYLGAVGFHAILACLKLEGAVMFHPQMIRPWLVQPVLYIPRIFDPPILLSHGAYIPWMVHPTGFLDPAPWTL